MKTFYTLAALSLFQGIFAQNTCTTPYNMGVLNTENQTCYTGTTVGAGADGYAICSGTADDDVWVAFRTPVGHLTTTPIYFEVRGNGYGFSLQNPVLNVRTAACGGASLNCIDARIDGTEVASVTGLNANTLYYLRLYSFANTAGSRGTFQVCAQVNSVCANAISLTFPYNKNVSTLGSGNQYNTAQLCATIGGGNDLVYTFNVPAGGGNFMIEMTSPYANELIGWRVLNGCPGAVGTTCLKTGYDNIGLGNSLGEFYLPAGNYYLVLDNYSLYYNSATYELNLKLLPLTATNGTCASPLTIANSYPSSFSGSTCNKINDHSPTDYGSVGYGLGEDMVYTWTLNSIDVPARFDVIGNNLDSTRNFGWFIATTCPPTTSTIVATSNSGHNNNIAAGNITLCNPGTYYFYVDSRIQTRSVVECFNYSFTISRSFLTQNFWEGDDQVLANRNNWNNLKNWGAVCIPDCQSNVIIPASSTLGRGQIFNANTILNNRQDGIVFTMEAANDITLDYISIIPYSNANNVTVEIYSRPTGHTSSNNYWKLEGSTVMNLTGNVLTQVPIHINQNGLPIPQGQKYGFYVTLTTSATSITYETYTGPIGGTLTDGNIILYREGHGGAYKFVDMFYPRTFNGSFQYRTGSVTPAYPIVTSTEPAASRDLTIRTGGNIDFDNTNGTMLICGNFVNNGVFNSSGNGVVRFTGNTAQTFSGTGTETWRNIQLANTATPLDFRKLTIMKNVNVNGNFIFTTGRIETFGNVLNIVNTSATAISGFNSNNYVQGNLRRNFVNGGNYAFPIGDPNFPGHGYQRIDFNKLNCVAATNLLANYDPTTPSSLPTSSWFSTSMECGNDGYDNWMGNGFWRIQPNVPETTASYDVFAYPATSSLSMSHLGFNYTPHSGNASATLIKKPTTGGANSWTKDGDCFYGSTLNGTPIVGRLNVNTGFSDFAGLVDINMPFPVELLTFTAKTQGKNAVLNWITASEKNNLGFEIYRSLDGISFENIGFVEGKGNTQISSNYEFKDVNLTEKIYFYRLKQLDFDGASIYSPTLQIEFNKNNSLISSIFPNPSSQHSDLILNLEDASEVQISIVNSLGSIIQQSNYSLSAGKNQIPIETSKIANGIYFITCKMLSQELDFKLIVMK